MTPLLRLVYLTIKLEVEHAMIDWNGLYLETYLAILPVSVKHTNISTLLSKAMLQAVEANISTDENFFAFFT